MPTATSPKITKAKHVSQAEAAEPAQSSETRERIMDAALELFAVNGFHGTSMRAITQKAGVSLALVNYHFQSKEQLRREIIIRRFGPINQDRLDRLTELEKKYGKKPIPLASIWEALIRPLLRSRSGERVPIKTYVQFIMRMHVDEPHFLHECEDTLLVEVFERYTTAMQKTMPFLDYKELMWRGHFAGSLIMGVLGQPEKLGLMTQGAVEQDDDEETIRRMIIFLSAGYSATELPEKSSA